MINRDWDEDYRTGFMPWDTGEVDWHLKRVIKDYAVAPGKALEMGCGTGTNAIWLAKRGFRVTAVDVSSIAIAMAKKKVARTRADIKLVQGDVLRTAIKGRPFGFVFDRGLFHHLDDLKRGAKLAKTVHGYLKKGGLWFSLIGSADGPLLNIGPPRRSARDIVSAVESHFKILLLRATEFGTKTCTGPAAWECLMMKR